MFHSLQKVSQNTAKLCLNKGFHSSSRNLNFGIIFDIDGVLVRGTNVLPRATEAFKLLVNEDKNFKVPVTFVTNAGNSLRKDKANQLSEWLNVKVNEEQVVMSHSPLRLFSNYHKKTALVTGQGPVRDIASNLGFQKVFTIEDLRRAYPSLDAVDQERRQLNHLPDQNDFPRIETIVMFGEPVRWETTLQLVMDLLITNGVPVDRPESAIPYPHLPILACNMDLQWMATAKIPRFGHGAFLVCLEHIYKKITGGLDLKYTALVGKPSELTFRYAEILLQVQSQELGNPDPLNHLYCVGDNVCTDVYGANLYHNYLERHHCHQHKLAEHPRDSMNIADLMESPEAKKCVSLLVETGVHVTGSLTNHSSHHSPRDFLPVEDGHHEPSVVVRDVYEAVKFIFEQEGFTN